MHKSPCTNTERYVTVASNICTAVRNVCTSSVRILLRVTQLAPRILVWVLHLLKLLHTFKGKIRSRTGHEGPEKE